VERLSGKPVELGSAPPEGQGSWWAGGCGCLSPRLVGRGSSPSTRSWSPAGPDGQGSLRGGDPVVPCVAGAQQGLKGGGLGAGVLASCGTSSELGSSAAGCGNPGGLGSGGRSEGRVSRSSVGVVWGWRQALLRGAYPGGVWIRPAVGLARGCGLAQPKGWKARQNGAAALQAYGVGRGFGRPAVLLLDGGMEKASMI
jgi:hypothetical protein